MVLLIILGFTANAQYPGKGQEAIDPLAIPKFVDYLPHFAGLRVNATNGGNLIVKAVMTQQIAVSTGTVLENGRAGIDPGAGEGNFFVYTVSKDGGQTWTLPLWPAFTIEAKQNKSVDIEVINNLFGLTYEDVNIAADQTIMMDGVPLTGDPLTEPYHGPVPIALHLHGGEVSSLSDGGPGAWFTPGYELTGYGWEMGITQFLHYPNTQEPATLWYHEHSQLGLTRINVYAGMQGFYFLRGNDEERGKLPGWSGDDLVNEVTPEGRTSDVLHPGAYLPEIELAMQDRMFDTYGELFYPVEPTNEDLHPFWSPEFFGDVITVNGKTWPYLSVAPRKYRFRILDGANARFFNLWLENLETGQKGPAIIQVGTDGGLLDSPVVLDPAAGKKLLLGCGERADVIIDFSGFAEGTVLTMMNNAATPYPDGDPVVTGTTDRIMQFVVNGTMADNKNPSKKGKDKSNVPNNLRGKPLIKLTNFNGSINVPPDVTRQLTLNEVMEEGGPERVLLNNSVFMETEGTDMFGEPTEIATEGKVEKWQIINMTMDAHPIHLHLVQFQLVSRQTFNEEQYMEDYMNSFTGINGGMAGMYMGAEGPPFLYNDLNSDNAVGGNLPVSQYLTGNATGAAANEKGWKDVIIVYPGQVTTFAVRYAPTALNLNTKPEDLVYGFDPSEGPGYVWHCHILEHEDNDMMRPLMMEASPERNNLKKVLADKDQLNAQEYLLGQNYPNPFFSSTVIPYKIPEGETVTIEIYNSMGSEITTVTEKPASTGMNYLTLDRQDLPPGVYFYQIRCGNYTAVKKMIVSER